MSGVSSVKKQCGPSKLPPRRKLFPGYERQAEDLKQPREENWFLLALKIQAAKETNLDLKNSCYISGRTWLDLHSSWSLERSSWDRISRKGYQSCLLSSPCSFLPGFRRLDSGSAGAYPHRSCSCPHYGPLPSGCRAYQCLTRMS